MTVLVCPDCGKNVPWLHEETGFCQSCTNTWKREHDTLTSRPGGPCGGFDTPVIHPADSPLATSSPAGILRGVEAPLKAGDTG